MLALDSPRWAELEDAYGLATEAPALLERLSASTEPMAGWQEEPWSSLWSRFCHQGSIFTRSYATVPHVVEIARRAKARVDFSFFAFPAAIEVARVRGNGPELPHDLAEAYRNAIRQLTDIIEAQSGYHWDRATIRSAAAALAVAKSDVELADSLLNLDDEGIDRITAEQ